jgi:hypothetical protein
MHQLPQSNVYDDWHSLQSAALVLLWDLVVRPSVPLALQEFMPPPMLSVGSRALRLPPGQKLPAGHTWQDLEVPLRNW